MTRSTLALILCLGLVSSGLAAKSVAGTPVAKKTLGWEKPESTWSDAKLKDYLSAGNRPEGVMIKRLTVRQNAEHLPLYAQTGEEERGKNLEQRPILTLAETSVPFSRNVRYVARVDRKHGIALDLDLEHVVRLSFSPSGVRRQPIPTLYVYLKPGQEEEVVLPGVDGRFALEIPHTKQCGEALFQFRSGDERHEITVVFLNRKRPVTIDKSTTE